MAAPSVEEYRAGKDPRYNAKKTIAVTERVLRNWCARSNAYLWNVENGQKRALQIETEVHRTGKIDGRAVFPFEASLPFEIVSYDNLEYGLEMTLKAAQMVDGYHEFNKEISVPGFIENFEVNGLMYVYVKPTHQLDVLYNKCLSNTMKEALQNFLPLKLCLDQIYETLHPKTMDLTWVAGRDYRAKAGRVRYDSMRYTSDWTPRRLHPRFVLGMLAPLRRLNGAIPLWFRDRHLGARPS